jgi:hypothetical protein
LLPAEHIKECFEAYRNPSIREHGNSPASQKDSSIEWGVLEERLGVHDFQTEVVLRGRTLPTVTIDLAWERISRSRHTLWNKDTSMFGHSLDENFLPGERKAAPSGKEILLKVSGEDGSAQCSP